MPIKKRCFLLFLLYHTASVFLLAQDRELQLLKERLRVEKNDTSRLGILRKLSAEAPEGEWQSYNLTLKKEATSLLKNPNPKIQKRAKQDLATALNDEGFAKDAEGNKQEAIKLYRQSFVLRTELNHKPEMAQSLNNLAALYEDIGETDSAIVFYQKSLRLREESGEKSGIAESLNNLGLVYAKTGDAGKALDYYQRSILIKEIINDREGLATTYNNMAMLYDNVLDDQFLALKSYRMSLYMFRQLKNKKREATALNNMGRACKNIARSKSSEKKIGYNEKYLDSARYYYRLSKDISEHNKDAKNLASALHNLGELYQFEKKYPEADQLFQKALLLRRQNNDIKDITVTLTALGMLAIEKGKPGDAETYAKEAYANSKVLGFPENIGKTARLNYECYLQKKDFRNALLMFREFVEMRDSSQNKEIRKQLMRRQFQFEYAVKQKSDSLVAVKEKQVMQLKLEEEKNQRYALLAGLLLVLAFSGVLFNRFKTTQRQKKIIENKEIETQKQKLLVEEKNREILSSIEYAKRIQATILPSDEELDILFPEHFVLYLPKDIVAGDFYWIGKDNPEAAGKSLMAACDSTGHGVPGALVSIVCSQALEKAYKEFQLSRPAQILDKAAEIVTQEFSRNNAKGDEIKDGMDVSLLALSPSHSHPDLMLLEWAGANNPLWIIRKNNSSPELVEISPDKQPIGKSDIRKPFTHHELWLEKGTCVYLFTDGFADQFGGPKGGKLTRKRFKELLMANAHKTMDEQKKALLDFHLSYRGKEEQVDDICVIGICV